MQAIVEFFPWILFGIAYKFSGLMAATAALMGGMVVLIAYDWITARKIPQMHLLLAALVWVFGAATLLLHDVRFLQWKASVFYWLLGVVFCGSVWIGKQSLLERLLGPAVPEEVQIPQRSWRSLSLVSGLFYIALGCVNLWVAQHRTESEWVTFKVWIAMPLAVAFSIGVALWLLRGLFSGKSAS